MLLCYFRKTCSVTSIVEVPPPQQGRTDIDCSHKKAELSFNYKSEKRLQGKHFEIGDCKNDNTNAESSINLAYSKQFLILLRRKQH